jgi:predicted dehydrogenase
MAIKIRWGILGTGYIAGKFAEALAFLPDAELEAIGSRTQNSASAFARRHNVPRVYGSYQALAQDPKVDVIYIATPNGLHHENCLAVLQAGKPVLCEKPFMVNSSEAEEVITLARQKKLFLMEALWTQFIPAFVEARRMWEAGEIGEVRLVTADFGYICDRTPPAPLYNPVLAGGSIMDVGTYPISLAHLVFGEPDTTASLAHIGASQVDEQTGILLGHRGGQIAVGYSSFEIESPKEAVVMGTKGLIRIHSPFYCPAGFTLCLNDKEPREFRIPYEGNGWNYQAVEVMQCLRTGKLESAEATHGETLALMRTMDRIRAQIGLKLAGEV